MEAIVSFFTSFFILNCTGSLFIYSSFRSSPYYQFFVFKIGCAIWGSHFPFWLLLLIVIHFFYCVFWTVSHFHLSCGCYYQCHVVHINYRQVGNTYPCVPHILLLELGALQSIALKYIELISCAWPCQFQSNFGNKNVLWFWA